MDLINIQKKIDARTSAQPSQTVSTCDAITAGANRRQAAGTICTSLSRNTPAIDDAMIPKHGNIGANEIFRLEAVQSDAGRIHHDQ